MHYTDSGAGLPVVLAHAFPVDSRMWNGVRQPLAGRARVITPDQRGLGRSPLDTGDGVPEPSLDVAADDLLRLLDDLGVDRFVVGGCSLGGYVAMAVLRRAAERVAGLLLVDTRATADDAEQRATRLGMAERLERDGAGDWLASTLVPGMLGATTRADRPEVVEEVARLVSDQPAAGVAWTQRAMAARPDSTDLLGAVTVPALVVVGEQDTMTPPQVASQLAARLPQGRLAVLPECGHLSPVEAPEAFVDAVGPWLTELAGRG
ncbi:alpha/beta fold hydrolase [Goodfellowiella coeruleoviolacea]|uniref:Pimeloyl-ACP methyl ester carboxylesterase n=1 Tax=Goodfellowiella coeruleoviolacea TaxID=334858 RepID=A0AAE3GF48_9PSEU|nr:alpha/beta fold hydrolase [Goodfellowiella coeruleoviolacea]MCP2166975.1 Pimeloyl-ACP methyl ester carboxylesterase [Goodfellowiella coeruleoviolacea]